MFPELDLGRGTVLLIDDDASMRQAYREYLGEDDRFTTFYEAANGIEGFQVLANDADDLDLVLCDLEMPEFDGFKFLQMRATRQDFAAVPVIIVTSRQEQAQRIRGLELGAADYLTKPVLKPELQLRAQHQLKIRRLQTELRSAIAELKHLSQTDPLTHVSNRRHFVELYEHEFERAYRYDTPLGIAILDIDDFKQVNDTYGHIVGDTVLKSVAQILSYGARQSDIVARYGGEEFAVLLPQTDLEGTFLVAERYRHEIDARQFRTKQATFQLTVSVGIAALPETPFETPTELLNAADKALYEAKAAGKNRTGRADR